MKILKPLTMNCSPTIGIALMLLSLTAGMFLLYKTKKESLGTFFKIVSWFVIVVSLGSMICCTMRCVFHGCNKGGCERMEQCGPGGSEECGEGEKCGMGHHGGMNKRVMIFKGEGGECEVECEMEGKGCCKDKMECSEGKEGCEGEKRDCCKKGGAHECGDGGEKKCEMKMEMKKDTVVVKKK
jgi:hypothetical protein